MACRTAAGSIGTPSDFMVLAARALAVGSNGSNGEPCGWQTVLRRRHPW